MKLNIACHTFKFDGWLNCDLDPAVEPDQVVDFTKRLPWVDDTFDEIYCGHFLEHLDMSETDPFLAECKRVMAPGASALFIIPDVKKSTDWLLEGKMERDWYDMILAGSDQYGGHKQVYTEAKLVEVLKRYFNEMEAVPCSEIRVCDVGYQSAVRVWK